jgi:hypothetical protein
MSTLQLRAPQDSQFLPHFLRSFGFTHVVSIIAAVFDSFAYAKEQASLAHQRYPFGRW